jgi:hypothetical protein
MMLTARGKMLAWISQSNRLACIGHWGNPNAARGIVPKAEEIISPNQRLVKKDAGSPGGLPVRACGETRTGIKPGL